MFRFGAVLTVVLVAIGLLVDGVLTGSLIVVYAAIGTAALAGLLLMIGITFRRDEIFGSQRIPAEPGQSEEPVAGPPVTAAAGLRDDRAADRAASVTPAKPQQAAKAAVPQDPAARQAAPSAPAHSPPWPAAPEQSPWPTAPEPPPRSVAPPEPSPRPPRPTAPRDLPAEPARPAAAAQPPGSARPAAPRDLPAEPARPAAAAQPPARPADQPQPPASLDSGTPEDKTPEGSVAGGSATGGSATGGSATSGSATSGSATSGSATSGSATNGSAPDGTMRGQVTIVPGIPRYHRSGCTLIRFLGAADLETMTREAAEADGCVPCKACQPDKSTADEPSR